MSCAQSARGAIRTAVSVVARLRGTELHYSRLMEKDERTTLCRFEGVNLIDYLLRISACSMNERTFSDQPEML